MGNVKSQTLPPGPTESESTFLTTSSDVSYTRYILRSNALKQGFLLFLSFFQRGKNNGHH